MWQYLHIVWTTVNAQQILRSGQVFTGECKSWFSFSDLMNPLFVCTQTMPWFTFSKCEFKLKWWGIWIHPNAFSGPVANCFNLQDSGPVIYSDCPTATLKRQLWPCPRSKEELIPQGSPQDQLPLDCWLPMPGNLHLWATRPCNSEMLGSAVPRTSLFIWLYYLSAVWLWVSSLTSLRLSIYGVKCPGKCNVCYVTDKMGDVS